MIYKIGDKLEDNKTGEIIEIIEVTERSGTSNAGYEITNDGIYWEYGVTENYLKTNCTKLN